MIARNINNEIKEIAELFKSHKLVLFCGAGVSGAKPSYAPDWVSLRNDFVKALIGRLIKLSYFEDTCKEYLEKIEKVDEVMNFRLKPEMVFQLIFDDIKSRLFEVLASVLKKGKYNNNHLFMAKAGNKGYLRIIITTNFDTYIEDALDYLKVDYKIYSSKKVSPNILSPGDLLKRIKKGIWNADKSIVLFKVHGTISDPSSIIATLRQTGKNPSKNIRDIFTYLLGNYHFLFTGYSGNDFDIFPIISTRLRMSKKIFWNKRRGYNLPTIETLVKTTRDKVSIIEEDLNNLFCCIYDILFKELPMFKKRKDNINKCSELKIEDDLDIISRWIQDLDLTLCISILAKLAQNIGLRDLARKLYKGGLQPTFIKTNKYWKVYFLSGMSLTYKGENNEKAAYFIEKAKKYVEEIKKDYPMLIAKMLSRSGTVYFHMHRYPEAIKAYRRSNIWHRKAKKILEMATNYNELGNVFRDNRQTKKAMYYFQKALKIGKDKGDLVIQSYVYNNKGLIYLYKRGKKNWRKALYYFKKSMELKTNETADYYGLSTTYNNLGETYGKLRNPSMALSYFRKSICLKGAVRDRNGLAITYYNVAEIFFRNKKANHARRYCNKSLDLCKVKELKFVKTRCKNLLNKLR